LNEVVSALLALTLLLANKKCGLSASAAVAPIPTVVAAEMSTNAMRRIVAPPCQVFRTPLAEKCQAITP
jgi:hypothetical protein